MRARPGPRNTVLVGGLLGLVALAAVHLLQHGSYWNFSEGVYAYSSRSLLRGGDLYGDVVVAQPPVMLVLGAGILAVSDTLEWLRLAVGGLQLLAGVLAAVALVRLSAPRVCVLVAPALALLLPWAVHEHGALTPETVALPMLLGGALLVARRRGAPWAGVLLSFAVFTKVTFVVPAVLLVLVAADRGRAVRWLAGAVVVQAAAWTLIFGGGLWDDAVVAQSESATRSVRYLAEVLVQAGWNLAGLVGGAVLLAVAWWRARGTTGAVGTPPVAAGPSSAPADEAPGAPTASRAAAPSMVADPAQLRASVVLAASLLLTLGTMLKDGTGLNVLVPVEVALVPVGLLGLASAWATWPGRVPRAAVLALALLPLAQSAALLARPTDPDGFLRPLSADAWARVASDAEVDRQVAAARRCPPGVPYSGVPFYAFLADRRMPDGQPDLFITTRVSAHADTLARMNADAPRCP